MSCVSTSSTIAVAKSSAEILLSPALSKSSWSAPKRYAPVRWPGAIMSDGLTNVQITSGFASERKMSSCALCARGLAIYAGGKSGASTSSFPGETSRLPEPPTMMMNARHSRSRQAIAAPSLRPPGQRSAVATGRTDSATAGQDCGLTQYQITENGRERNCL
jgi:hypothetical protein